MPQLTRTLPGPTALRLVYPTYFVRLDDVNQPVLELLPPGAHQFPAYEARVEIKEELRPNTFEEHARAWPSVMAESEETVELVVTLRVPKSQLVIHAR